MEHETDRQTAGVVGRRWDDAILVSQKKISENVTWIYLFWFVSELLWHHKYYFYPQHSLSDYSHPILFLFVSVWLLFFIFILSSTSSSQFSKGIMMIIKLPILIILIIIRDDDDDDRVIEISFLSKIQKISCFFLNGWLSSCKHWT